MAKAQFHKNQRVYVKPVGTWAQIEHVLPQWVKDVEEPIRITYDVGLGREFGAEELASEATSEQVSGYDGENWRVMRGKNKWQQPDECSHHPHPGTYPIVVTGENDWGGWRVPGSEYDLYPERIEFQARLISGSIRLYRLTRELVGYAEDQPENISNELMSLIQDAKQTLKAVEQNPEGLSEETVA